MKYLQKWGHMPKRINLKRLGQANDTEVCIEVGAVVVRVNSCLNGGGPLAVPEHDVEGGALVEDGKAGCSGEHESVRDESPCTEVEKICLPQACRSKQLLTKPSNNK